MVSARISVLRRESAEDPKKKLSTSSAAASRVAEDPAGDHGFESGMDAVGQDPKLGKSGRDDDKAAE